MIQVPIRTVPGMNVREHWRARHRRVCAEKHAVSAALWTENMYFPRLGPRLGVSVPCTVRLTRVAPSNGLDTDNLAGSLKSVRDAVAGYLCVDDKHDDLVRYVYAQKRGPWSVEIEFGQPMKGEEFVPLEVTP